MSNGLLSGGGGFGGWDTTQIDKTNNNDNNSQHNTIDSLFDNEYNGNHQRSSSSSSAKLKPYKQQQQTSPADIDSNPFLSSAMNTNSNHDRNSTDNAYINPFIDFASSNDSQINQNPSQHHQHHQHHQHPQTSQISQTSHQSKQPSMNSIQENQTLDAEVLDLLFDTNPTNTNSNQNNSNNANDAFYAFDFGVNNNDDNKPKSNGRPKQKILSDEDDDSSSEEEEEDDESTEDEDEDEDEGEDSNDHDDDDDDDHNHHKGEDNQYSSNDLKLSPPKQQTKRSKKRRQSLIEENEKAFNKLHNQFDPSLVGTFPINKNEAKSQAIKAKQQKKRNTEPINIHSKRQKQLEKEGLIKSPKKMQSPNIGKSLRNKSNGNKNMNDDEKKENKNKNKKPKTKSKYNVLPELHRGTALLKYGRRGYPHFRQFNLTADNENLRWFSSKKKLQQSSINVGDINEILTGQHTKEFRRIAWTTLTPASFSVIYDNKKKSLNLVAKSVDEMKMWVEALRTLRDLKRKGEVQLNKMDKLMVEVDFRDRNRPQSRNHSGNFIRSHETKEREVDPILQRKLIDDIAAIRKQFNEIAREANNPIIQSTKEYESIEQILSELEERVEELDHEVRNTRNTKIAENDVWRTRIDLESLREKIKVITKQNKQNYKASKRRWSVF